MDEKKKDKQTQAVSEKSGGFAEWLSGITGEFKRIAWPDRNSLVKMTVTVIVTSGVFGGIIVLYDFILAAGYDGLVSLFG
ncbi:MAG: preprotein translocase subunit SecE [Defluviitaleaceae bacterium]|nr:preprotein translocase subunit SecE [Defluviitaleaceae bacterium]